MRGDKNTNVDKVSWRIVSLSVLAYVGLGLVVRYIPNPIVGPPSILALNMVVVVVAAYFGGTPTGAVVGGGATLLNFIIKLLLSAPAWSPDYYELVAVIPHAIMGAGAGFVGRRGERLITAATILIGHTLNIIAFVLTGLLSLQDLATEVFWNALLAEATVDLILIVLALGLIQGVQTHTLAQSLRRMDKRRRLIVVGGIGSTMIFLSLLFLLNITLAPYLFVVPVALAAIFLGSLGAWVCALLLSIVLGLVVVSRGLPLATHEVALILSLNLMALVIGRMAENVMEQRRLAEQHLVELEAQQQLAEQRLVELKATYAALEDADRIKSEMIQNISHELRTPLSIILGHTELLATGILGALTDDQLESINAAHRHGQRLTYLVEQVTVLHQVETGRLSWQVLVPEALVHTQVERYLSPALAQGCRLRVAIDGDISPVESDPEYLGQALSALLDNAIKFSPAGGDVTVKLWGSPERVYFSVEDKGIGIPPDQHARIFERFYQVDGSIARQFGGLGTGLALVKEVVEAHGGEVWVESTPGQGSLIGFWLPLRPPTDRQYVEATF